MYTYNKSFVVTNRLTKTYSDTHEIKPYSREMCKKYKQQFKLTYANTHKI